MIRSLAALLILFFTPQLVSAETVIDYPTGFVAGGIGMSRHNMGSAGRVISTPATSEICVFCHTPHNAGGGGTPLWNKSTDASSTYTAYGTTSSGTFVGQGDLSPATLACMSCHDGVSTFDNLVDRPGKGTVSGDQDWQFVMPGGVALVMMDGSMPPLDHFSSENCSSCHKGEFYYEAVARLNIGRGFGVSGLGNTDVQLTDDHPVSIPYDEGLAVAGLRAKDTVISTIDLTAELSSTAASVFNGNLAQNRWAVNGMVSDTATIGDLLVDGKVECTSCHDPHFRNLSWDEVEASWSGWDWCDGGPGALGENCTDGNFLRRVGGNTGSAVCRTCHNK